LQRATHHPHALRRHRLVLRKGHLPQEVVERVLMAKETLAHLLMSGGMGSKVATTTTPFNSLLNEGCPYFTHVSYLLLSL